jgi:HEPN domain-containing protein
MARSSRRRLESAGPSPTSPDARLFSRCAYQRFEDAEVLLRNGRSTGAVYLAGYGVECILKALILESSAPAESRAMLGSFRGRAAHNLEWLRAQYRRAKGAPFPLEVTRSFTLVLGWTTEMRYKPGSMSAEDAETFLSAAAEIIKWAQERI